MPEIHRFRRPKVHGPLCLAIKDNQKLLCENVEEFFGFGLYTYAWDIPTFEVTGKSHGRIGHRRIWSTEDIDWLEERKDWKDLKSLILVASTRIRDHQESTEHWFFISSLPGSDVEVLGAEIRAHWGIEGRLHWILDISFRED